MSNKLEFLAPGKHRDVYSKKDFLIQKRLYKWKKSNIG